MPVDATSLRIFQAAEVLFAENGFHGTTLREITAAAGVNLAAVNYYYGDKQSLYVEIMSQRLGQINTARLAVLAAAEATHAPEPIPLQTLLELLAAPLLGPVDFQPAATPASRQLLGRVLVEPLPLTAKLVAAEFQPGMARFGQQLRRHFPAIPASDFLWKLSIIVGALHHTVAALPRMNGLTSGICQDNDADAALRHYVILASRALGAS